MILDFFGQFATKDQVAIDKKSNFTNFNDYTYECMEFVNLSNITGEKPVASGIALFISKKGNISTTFSGYLQVLITRDGRVFGRQIYGRNGTITQYGAWVEWYANEINKTYDTTKNVDDLIENLNDCVLGRAYEFDSSMANVPSSVGGVVNSFGNGNDKYQIAYTKESTPSVYIRTKFGSAGWSDWDIVGGSMDLLWQNASATSMFAAQTISPSNFVNTKYSFYIVRYKFSTGTAANVTSVIVDTGVNYQVYMFSDVTAGTGLPRIHQRSAKVTSDNKIEFSDAYENYTDQVSSSVDNTFLIPIYVYGVK